MVDQGRDLGVRVGGDEAGAELLPIADLDQPGVVFRAAVACGQQFLQHDRDLDAVRRTQGVKLERMLAYRQFLLKLGAGGRLVDAGELAAGRLFMHPDFRRDVFCFAHGSYSLVGIALGGM